MFQDRGPGDSLLGTYGDSATIPAQGPDRRVWRRASRHGVKAWQRGVTESISSRLCFFASGPIVRVDISTELVAHVSGVHHCGSPWSCPICAPVVRERRAQEVDLALSGHLGSGGGGLFVTFASRHHRADDLAPRLDLMGEVLHSTLQGRTWSVFKRRLGYMGACRVVEVTYGFNGWHPHCHSAFVLEGRPVFDVVEDLQGWLFERFQGVCLRRGFGTLERPYGVDVRGISDGGGMGDYLSKVEGGWTAGLELARGDVKVARGDGGRSPFSILRAAASGDSASAALWSEYERATFGKRFLRWSPGLRARLLPEVEEISDVEAAAAEGAGVVLFSCLFEGEVWDVLVTEGSTGVLLAELERAVGDGDVLDVLERWGGMTERDYVTWSLETEVTT